MSIKKLSEDIAVDILASADIGGTNASTPWVSMANFERVYAKVILGTWDAADDLDECRLQQATSAAGAGAKDLTTDASGGDYDTDAPVDAATNTVVLEAKAAELDVNNGFTHVRLYVAEGGNTGPDFVTGVLIRHGAKYPKSHLEADAAAGVTVYVSPGGD